MRPRGRFGGRGLRYVRYGSGYFHEHSVCDNCARDGQRAARQPETTSKAPSASQPAASQPAAGAPTTGAPTTSKAPSASQPASSQAAHAQTVYWGHTGEKVHISPNCRTIKNGALSGTLAEARAAGRGDWCKVCSKGWSDERLKSEGNPNAD